MKLSELDTQVEAGNVLLTGSDMEGSVIDYCASKNCVNCEQLIENGQRIVSIRSIPIKK
jgi:hypothetical protein